MTASPHDQPRGAHSARAALADAAAPHPGGHDDHGAGHGDSSGGDRSGWVLLPLLAGLVAAVVLIVALGIGADAPERTERLGPRAAEEHADDTGMVEAGGSDAEGSQAEAEPSTATSEP